jgi:predicted HicB family RNase H-like nuclease
MLSYYQDNLIGGVIIKQIIVRLQDDLHQALKLKTIKDGVSIQGFMESIIKEYLRTDMKASNFLEKLKK